MMKQIVSGLLCAAMLLAVVGCQGNSVSQSGTTSGASSEEPVVKESSSAQVSSSEPESQAEEDVLPAYSDVRYAPEIGFDKEVYAVNEFLPEDIQTFTFNERTVLTGSEQLAAQILEAGKNPGLGVRSLHERGITGKGVNVAIIDQHLLLDHPEFEGKIAAYYDAGCEVPENEGSMHGPGVTSLLVGETIGVAPGAKVYYVARPSWKKDSKYGADAIRWIIEQNQQLPEGEKIRVISFSGGYGTGTDTKNPELWDKAKKQLKEEGILLLDCSNDPETGIIEPAFYDPEFPEDVSKCTGGFPDNPRKFPSSYIGVPVSYRTLAEEYLEGTPSYQYNGSGGLSWGIPYAAGVLALGWQVDPTLTNEEIIKILFETCGTGADGSNIINPVAFIEAIEKRAE